jgi:hypothetical protein
MCKGVNPKSFPWELSLWLDSTITERTLSDECEL